MSPAWKSWDVCQIDHPGSKPSNSWIPAPRPLYLGIEDRTTFQTCKAKPAQKMGEWWRAIKHARLVTKGFPQAMALTQQTLHMRWTWEFVHHEVLPVWHLLPVYQHHRVYHYASLRIRQSNSIPWTSRRASKLWTRRCQVWATQLKNTKQASWCDLGPKPDREAMCSSIKSKFWNHETSETLIWGPGLTYMSEHLHAPSVHTPGELLLPLTLTNPEEVPLRTEKLRV